MSWDATLVDDRGHVEAEFNYTSNTNGMIHAALDAAGHDYGEHWCDHLDGADGPAGAALCKLIADELDRDPGRYGKMNPANGWGSRDGIILILRKMSSCCPEWPCRWSVSR